PQSYFQERFGGHSWKQEYTQAVNSGAIVRDEATRLWKPAPGFELAVGSIVGQMNEFETRNTQFWSDLSRSNPLEKIYNDLLPALQRAWQADVDSRLKQQVQSASQEDVIASFE